MAKTNTLHGYSVGLGIEIHYAFGEIYTKISDSNSVFNAYFKTWRKAYFILVYLRVPLYDRPHTMSQIQRYLHASLAMLPYLCSQQAEPI